jgi:hypothetical protein
MPRRRRKTDFDRIVAALGMAEKYHGTGGAHHKDWIIDQMVRALCGGEPLGDGFTETPWYRDLVSDNRSDDYPWPLGQAPQ